MDFSIVKMRCDSMVGKKGKEQIRTIVLDAVSGSVRIFHDKRQELCALSSIGSLPLSRPYTLILRL
jgi:hypothetical protein